MLLKILPNDFITIFSINFGARPLWRHFLPLSIFFASSSIKQKMVMIKSSIDMSESPMMFFIQQQVADRHVIFQLNFAGGSAPFSSKKTRTSR